MLHLNAYSNFVPITQTSGTGKSRMVHEQANLVFTIPFNLRDDNGNMSFPTVILLSSYQNDVDLLSFPPSDALVRCNLTDDTMETVTEAKLHFYIFLGHFFAGLKKNWKKFMKERTRLPCTKLLQRPGANIWMHRVCVTGCIVL